MMQRNAAYFGSRVEILNMIIVFSITLFFSASGVPEEVYKLKTRQLDGCCPTKLCYHANVSSKEKIEFVITQAQAKCTCEPEATQNCMKTFKDIEFAISKLHRNHDVGMSTTQVPPTSVASVLVVRDAPVDPASVEATTKGQTCCASKLCLEVGYLPKHTKLELIVTLTSTNCTCLSKPGISCLDSFERIEQACRSFEDTKYIAGP